MIILVGASASGKTEVAKNLAKVYKINKVITHTTRAMRVNETNGVDYNFVSVDEFAKLTQEDFFVETTYYNSNYYGTAKKDIKDDKCIILDPNGLKSFIALNDSSIISIFLSSDEQKRYERMIYRKDSEENAKKRIINDRIAFSDANLNGITHVVNSDLYNIDELSEVVYNIYMKSLGK